MHKDFADYEDFRLQLRKSGIPGMIKAWRKTPLPSRILREALDLHSNDDEILRFLAEYPMTPADLVEQLCEKQLSSETARAVCQHPRASLTVFNFAKDHPDQTVRAAVCANKNLPSRILQVLAEDPQPGVRAAVANSPLLKAPQQARLASDPDSAVRNALAANPRLETEVALVLAVDPSPLVRATTALLAPVNAEILREWAASGDFSIEDALLGRDDLAAEDGAWLIFSSNSSTPIQAAQRWPNHPMVRTRMALSTIPLDRNWLATSKDLSRSLQVFLAQDPNDEIKQSLASYPQLAPEARQLLLQANTLEVLERLSLNSSVPIPELESSEHYPALQIHLLYREDLPESLLQNWIQQNPSEKLIDHLAWLRADLPWLDANTANHLCVSKRPLRRRLSATSHQLPTEAVERLCRDECAEVRETLAQNPGISEIILDELSFDSDESVARTAKKFLQDRRKKARAAASLAQEPSHVEETHRQRFHANDEEDENPSPSSNWFQRLRLKLSTANLFSD